MTINTRISRGSLWFMGLTALYALLAFILPASARTKAAYHFDDTQYHILVFVVRLPIIAVWLIALYSYIWLRRYARRIEDTPEGEGFMSITKGMKWIAWGLLLPGIASAFLSAIANVAPSFHSWSLIITNYLYMVVAVGAFIHIYKGTHILTLQNRIHFSTLQVRTLLAILAVFCVVFCVLIANKLNATAHNDWFNSYNAYYLPNFLIWTTIVLPYVFAWFMGITAALELLLVGWNTSGVIYRRSMQLLASGLILVILSMCAMQYFRSVIPRTGHLAIGPTLITAYIIYAGSATGSILLAQGAKKLQRIEEI